jgi:hypothetical protein
MATKAEQAWMSKASQFCIVCYLQYMIKTPAAIHHLLTLGKRRRGHLYSIGLCDPGHHKNPQPGSRKIARHPTKTRFEAAYGTEDFLLAEQRRLIAEGRG